MNRRSFLGALAAVLAAPSILAKLRPAPATWSSDILDGVPTSVHELRTSTVPQNLDEFYWSQGVQDDVEAMLVLDGGYESRSLIVNRIGDA